MSLFLSEFHLKRWAPATVALFKKLTLGVCIVAKALGFGDFRFVSPFG
jgi:hypothetical protein